MTESLYVNGLAKTRRNSQRLWWLGMLSGTLFLIFLGLNFLFLHTSIFRVKAVEISGNNQVSEGGVAAILYARVGSDSVLDRILGNANMLSWPDKLNEEDLKYTPAIKSVSIQKNFSKKSVKVTVLERTARGIWCLEKSQPASCYWFDEDGVLFKPAFSSEGNLIRVVRDYAHTSLGMGNPILSKDLLPNLFEVLSVLEESDLSVKEVGLYDLSLEELEVATFSGPRVLFSLRFPPEGAAEVIESLRTKKSFNSLNYIDFRVEHRAYYK